MAIILDPSTTGVVVYCEECGHWRAFAWTRSEAEQAALRHEHNVHPDQVAWRDKLATRQRVARHRAHAM